MPHTYAGPRPLLLAFKTKKLHYILNLNRGVSRASCSHSPSLMSGCVVASTGSKATYVLGVDGGTTNTDCAVLNLCNGSFTSEQGGSCNRCVTSPGVHLASETVLSSDRSGVAYQNVSQTF